MRRQRSSCGIIGVGEQLTALEQEEKELYNERLYVGRTADQKEKFAKEQPYYPEAPADLVSASELIKEQQEILAKNGENQRKRERLHQLEQDYQKVNEQLSELFCKTDKDRGRPKGCQTVSRRPAGRM